jgi:CRISPR system Cascade subunit CasB
MTEPTDWKDRFIARLRQLEADQDLGTLACLRRGLAQEPIYVLARVGWLFSGVPERFLETACQVAALFAAHPRPGGSGNLGDAFRRLRDESGGAERRFAALLDTDSKDLPGRLRQAISLLRSKEVTLDWLTLLQDLLAWDYGNRPVQRRWARAFWQESPTDVAGVEGAADTD